MYGCALKKYRELSDKFLELPLEDFIRKAGGVPSTLQNNGADRAAFLYVLNQRAGNIDKDGSLKKGQLESILD